VDFSDRQVWKNGAAVVIGAPHIVVPLLAAVAIGVWWFRGRLEKSGKDGLNGTISNLNSKIAVLNERLEYAKDRLADAKHREEEVRRAYAELQGQIAANASKETLAATAGKVDTAITQLSTANNALAVALTAMDLTTGPPDLGKPTFSITKRSD